MRKYERSYLITVQLKIQVSLVCVQAYVSLFLHILVTYSVVCNSVCKIRLNINLADVHMMKIFHIYSWHVKRGQLF